MLKYFLESKNISQVKEICCCLNKIKNNINKHNFVINNEEKVNNKLFEEIIDISKVRNDELLANSSFVFKQYVSLFYSLCKYFTMLGEHDFELSWSKLQDCLDIIYWVKKFTKSDNLLDIGEIYSLLNCYESLYPYNVFISSEIIVKKSHCSICKKRESDLICPHIKGNLYWGELAINVIDDLEFKGFALVTNPLDKRCVVKMIKDKSYNYNEFKLLENFMALNSSHLNLFRFNYIPASNAKIDATGIILKKLYSNFDYIKSDICNYLSFNKGQYVFVFNDNDIELCEV